MRSLTAALVGVGLVGGFAVAAAGYQGSPSSPGTRPAAVVALPTARPTVVEKRLRPCEAGWRQTRGGACLRVLTKVVAAPAARSAVRQVPVAAPHSGAATRVTHDEVKRHPADDESTGSVEPTRAPAPEDTQEHGDDHEDDHEDDHGDELDD